MAHHTALLYNYAKAAWRSLRSHPVFTGINVAGLGVGMATVLLLALYVHDEWQYDRFHAHAERIYRVASTYGEGAGAQGYARSMPAIAPHLQTDFDAVEQAVRLQRYTGALRFEDQQYNEQAMFFADPAFFQIFTFPLVAGHLESALTQPRTAVLTASTAQKYFGAENPMGQVVTLGDTLDLVVTGVAADIPATSHLQWDVLISFSTWQQRQAARGRDLDNLWTNGTYYTYILLHPNASSEDLEDRLPEWLETRRGQASASTRLHLTLQPLTRIHLYSQLRQELGPNGSITNVYIFSVVAGFILLISVINFMSLATARSVTRAREVGVRKVLGAQRKQLVGQFLSEAVILGILSLCVALLVAILSLPVYQMLTGKVLTVADLVSAPLIGWAVVLTLIVGVCAGSYPAAVLSGFRPVQVIKGRVSPGRSQRVRQGLVVCQFGLAIFILCATGVTIRQVDHMQRQHLGFEKEQVLVVPFYYDSSVMARYDAFKTGVLEQVTVHQVTASGDVPGRMFTALSYWAEGWEESERGGINGLIVDPDFVETYQMEIVAGQDFSLDQQADLASSFILNETAVAALGWTPEEAIGKQFRMNTQGTIIGVVQDFHFTALQQTVEPLAMTVWPDWFGYFSLQVDTERLPQTLAAIESVWHTVIPHRPFEYFFLDADFDRLYQAEEQFSKVFLVFAVLAILISCLGLFGLAAFTVEQRTREVGIRKVLGASVFGIIWMISQTFTRLVGIAALLAIPVAYLVMDQWLQHFAYRAPLSWELFLFGGLLALVIAWVTVGYQTVRVALGNPVQALREP